MFITGAKSGLGRYLYERLGGFAYTRDTPSEKLVDRDEDVIVHCAFNSSRGIDETLLYDYISDNVFLTKKIVSIPHKKFIYISSVDAYPKNKERHSEDEIIDVDSVESIYGFCKLISESIVKVNCSNYLILRLSGLLGPGAKKGSLIKIMENKALTVSGISIFNYVLYSDILSFIKIAVKKDLRGVYNLAASKNINIQNMAELLGKPKLEVDRSVISSYYYNVGKIDNRKASAVCPVFRNTSKENIWRFING